MPLGYDGGFLLRMTQNTAKGGMQIIKRSRVCACTSERAQIAPRAFRQDGTQHAVPPLGGGRARSKHKKEIGTRFGVPICTGRRCADGYLCLAMRFVRGGRFARATLYSADGGMRTKRLCRFGFDERTSHQNEKTPPNLGGVVLVTRTGIEPMFSA